MQVIMFGAGTTGRILYSEIASKDEVIAFADNNHERWGSCCSTFQSAILRNVWSI